MKLDARGAAFAAVALGLSAFGCAAADKPSHCGGGACDLGTGTGGNAEPDMADIPLPMPDLSPTGPMLGFGDTCTDNSQCKSGICVETGVGGVCSDLCPDGMCPAGYGCIGVSGQIDPGTVTYVCVPNSTQLCTPCNQSSECSLGGHDLCLPTPVGGHFCGRDCSKIGCPNGYACTDVPNSDMGTSKQCVPTSGSCDCDASKAGTTVACDIQTPTGVCKGTRTCNGASGWSGTCAPPSASDGPDDNYGDDNCDGIDGDVTRGIFVAKAAAAAVDDATCGTMAKPCKSINWGVSQAANAALRYVYVQASVYNEEVVLFNGIDIVGGYDTNWQRAARGTAGHDVVINGAFDSTEGQFIGVLAHSLTAQTTMWDLDIHGPNANDGLHPGYSTYAVHAYNAKLRLHRVGVFGGNGGDGKGGNNGTSASTTTAAGGMNGAVAPPSPPGPGPADEHSSSCETTGRGRGGDAGLNSCPDDDNTNGGPGGAGGTMDTSCTCVFGACVCNNCSATGGLNGGAAATAPSGYGYPGGGGSGGDGNSQGGNVGGPGRVDQRRRRRQRFAARGIDRVELLVRVRRRRRRARQERHRRRRRRRLGRRRRGHRLVGRGRRRRRRGRLPRAHRRHRRPGRRRQLRRVRRVVDDHDRDVLVPARQRRRRRQRRARRHRAERRRGRARRRGERRLEGGRRRRQRRARRPLGRRRRRQRRHQLRHLLAVVDGERHVELHGRRGRRQGLGRTGGLAGAGRRERRRLGQRRLPGPVERRRQLRGGRRLLAHCAFCQVARTPRAIIGSSNAMM